MEPCRNFQVFAIENARSGYSDQAPAPDPAPLSHDGESSIQNITPQAWSGRRRWRDRVSRLPEAHLRLVYVCSHWLKGPGHNKRDTEGRAAPAAMPQQVGAEQH